MSKYTTEVRFICETAAGLDESKGYSDIETIIAAARSKIFDFSYPLFDQNYKSVIETKILRHFYTREIGAETVGLWKHFLSRKLNEIMPYYNKLYQSELLEFNPFYDVDYTREGSRDNEGETNKTDSENSTRNKNGSGSSIDSGTERLNIKDEPKSDAWEYFSDTPQGGVDGLASMEYLTNATHSTASGSGSNRDDVTTFGKKVNTTDTESETGSRTGTGKETSTTTEEYLERVHGKQGTTPYSELLQKYRETFLNIDMMVIDELEPLFMGLW